MFTNKMGPTGNSFRRKGDRSDEEHRERRDHQERSGLHRGHPPHHLEIERRYEDTPHQNGDRHEGGAIGICKILIFEKSEVEYRVFYPLLLQKK